MRSHEFEVGFVMREHKFEPGKRYRKYNMRLCKADYLTCLKRTAKSATFKSDIGYEVTKRITTKEILPGETAEFVSFQDAEVMA